MWIDYLIFDDNYSRHAYYKKLYGKLFPFISHT